MGSKFNSYKRNVVLRLVQNHKWNIFVAKDFVRIHRVFVHDRYSKGVLTTSTAEQIDTEVRANG